MSEPVTTNKAGLIATMYELLDVTDHTQIGSRMRIRDAPNTPEVLGTRSNHRPDLFCKNVRGKFQLVETVAKEDMKDLDKLKDKLQLFYNASVSYDWDFHLVCFKSMANTLGHFCKNNAIRYSRLWDL